MRKVLPRRVWCVVGAWCVLSASALSAARGQPAVDDLLRDVSSVAAPGSPGTLALLRAGATPVVLGRVDGGRAFGAVVAAAPWERGRVVAFGHSGYLDAGALERGETAVLMERLIAWAATREDADTGAGAGDGTARRVGVLDGDLHAWLATRGFDARRVERLDDATLADLDALLIGGRDLTHEQSATLGAWVRAGGGLVAAQTGWGWQQIKSRGGAAPDMRTNALNRLLLGAGIAWTDEIIDETADDAFDATLRAAGPMALDVALDALLAAEGTPAPGNEPDDARVARRRALAQASATASRAVRLLPADDAGVRPRLRALMDNHAADLAPSEQRPLRSDKPLARMLLALQLDEINALPPERVTAHPASATFPGAVPAPDVAPRVTRTLRLDTTTGRWHSTGLYAPPGEVVTVRVAGMGTAGATSGSASVEGRGGGGGGLSVRIGCHTDTLWHHPEWKRVPEISRAWGLSAPETRVASAFGGLVYIDVGTPAPRGADATVEVTISGVVPAPRFVLGQTTREQWESELRRAPAPWAEIETPGVVVSVPAEALRRLDDPSEIAALWQEVLDRAADLRAISRQRPSSERIVPDVQISAGYMHSGYPIMTHLDVVDDLSLAATLRAGSWGLFHELGHNHQDGMWTFDGTVEVTCNLWSLYLMETISGKPVGTGHDALEPRAERETRTRMHLETGADFDRWKRDPFLALEMYVQLREAFGWEPFKRVFAEYDALPRGQRPRTDLERHDQWMARMSRATGRNLGPFFQRWGVPTTDEARASVAELPAWMPHGW